MESAHSDQASQAAVRWLVGLTPRPCCLIPSVTTALYSTTASQALRQTLRGSLSKPRRAELSKYHPVIGKRCMLASTKLMADFSRGCAHPAMQPPFSATHPHSALCSGTKFAPLSVHII